MSDDSLTVAESRQPDVEQRTVWLFFLAVSALHGGDANAAATHDHAVKILSENIDESLDVAAKILDQAKSDPLLRWSVVNTVAAMEHKACVKFLHEQATVDFGERDPKACEETRDSEIIVGIMAAEGLADLARSGDEGAVEAMIDIVRNQREVSVREAAGQPLLGVLKSTNQTPPKDIGGELDRIGALRALGVDDVTLDKADIEVQHAKRTCARKPATDGGSVPPSVHSNLKGVRNG